MPNYNNLPDELKQYIASYLDIKSLSFFAQISRESNIIYSNIIKQNFEELKQEHPYLTESQVWLFIYARFANKEKLEQLFREDKELDVNTKLHLYRDNGNDIDVYITPIHEAAYSGALHCVELFNNKGAIYKEREQQLYYLSPIHYAAAGGSEKCIEFFLTHGVPVDQQSTIQCPFGWNWTPLQIAANHGHSKCVELLLKYKANIHFKDPDKYQAIHRAAWEGHTNILEILLKNGADPNARNEDGITPLALSVDEGHVNCTKKLLEYKADINTMNFRMLHYATLLQIAIYNDDEATVIVLLAHDMTLARKTDFFFNQTALHYAVHYQRHKLLQILLQPKYAIDLTIKSSFKNQTALELAEFMQDRTSIDLFSKADKSLCEEKDPGKYSQQFPPCHTK